MSSQPELNAASIPLPEMEVVNWQFEPAVSAVILQSNWLCEQTYQWSKRFLDIIVSLLALVFAAPLLGVIAIAIKATSPGPVLYKHRRLGRNGQEFWCYKLRTMVADADQQMSLREDLRQKFETNYKLEDDPRVTPFGDFLRRTSLDELPQFWNVLVGDMSLIGPRPIVRSELIKYGRYAKKLLSVVPGLSGLWQTCGRSDITYEMRIQLDMLYIDHKSLWLDLTLLCRTFAAVIERSGAR